VNGLRVLSAGKGFYCQQVIGKPVLFGAEALDNRLSLDFCRPLERGIIKEGIERSDEAVKEIIRHLIDLAKPQPGQKIHAVVGVLQTLSRSTSLPSERPLQSMSSR